MKRYELRAIRRAKASQAAHLRKKGLNPRLAFYLYWTERSMWGLARNREPSFTRQLIARKLREARLDYRATRPATPAA